VECAEVRKNSPEHKAYRSSDEYLERARANSKEYRKTAKGVESEVNRRASKERKETRQDR